MTVRKPVSSLENVWHDAQRVDQEDLIVEQAHNDNNFASIVQNHFSSGVLLSTPQPAVLFDSQSLNADQAALLAANNFDGNGIIPAQQPSDPNLGNQLEVELTDSIVFGRLSVKVAIIGEAFDGTIQMDRMYFYNNCKQVTSKHYKTILALFFNDFLGNTGCSRNNGGRIIVRETSSFELSKDPIMISQDVQPDIFWRDWKLPNLSVSLFDTIQAGIGPEVSADGLFINITGAQNRILSAGDVTSQVGEKFQATTNNIQKVTLLLGASLDNTKPEQSIFDWTGELVISIYPLQSTVSCPSDIVPGLAIDFDPATQPLAQLSVDQAGLRDLGYVLTDVLQPVDFVFNSTRVGSPSTSQIIPGNYYAVTLTRVGATTSGNVLIGSGNVTYSNTRVTLFSGVWVDVPEENLWFQIWTDAAKVADGQGYDSGNGIMISKTIVDPATGATVDNQTYRHFSLTNTGENVLNTGVIQATLSESETVQDERTGNTIFSRQQFVPTFSFVDASGLAGLQSIAEPLVIGAMQDGNPQQNPTLLKIQTVPGLAKGDHFCIVNPDPDLLSLNLLGSKLIPNVLASNNFRIYRVTLCTDGYGDVNGDGYIDSNDITLASSLIGESIHFASTQQKIYDGYIDALALLRADVNGDGYVTSEDLDLITQYVTKVINSFPAGSSFTHLCLQVQQSIGRYDGYFDCNGFVRLDGYSGLNIVSPSDLSTSQLIYDGYLSTPIIDMDPAFSMAPFVPITYSVVGQPFWQPYSLYVSSAVRLVPTTFSYPQALVHPSCTSPVAFQCQDKNDIVPANNPGRNDFFVPNNLFIGDGELLRPDGSNYKVDLEIGTVILQLPQIPLSESAINVFDKFVADRGDGFTRAGFPAMKYADCSTVQAADLFLNKIRFSVSLQSFAPNLDGYTTEDGYGVIVDDIIGISIDPLSGILKLTIKDLSVDPVFMTLVSKIQILVYLKKGGWNNQVVTVTPNQVQGLISSSG